VMIELGVWMETYSNKYSIAIHLVLWCLLGDMLGQDTLGQRARRQVSGRPLSRRVSEPQYMMAPSRMEL
jgi:hypothetical protein